MEQQYPAAHLLSLPLELREQIYYHLTASPEICHIWDRKVGLHLSAAHAPPADLLRTHSILHNEALAYFYRNHRLTLHVDAFAFACLRNTNAYTIALQNCHYLQNIRVLDLRPTLNASIGFLTDAMALAVPVLLSPSFQVRKVVVTWAEAVANILYRTWRPWAYKGVALEPVWDLVGRVQLECGGSINPPPTSAEVENEGFRKMMKMITKYEELYKDSKGEYQEKPSIFVG